MTIHPDTLRPGVLSETPAARVSVAEPVARISIRTAPGDRASVADALGHALGEHVGDRVTEGGVETLCLGPDEWTLQAPEAQAGDLMSRLEGADVPMSAVEVTDRELTLVIDGAQAAELLTLGMPRDVNSIAVGSGRRTVFDSATVVLWRDGEQAFRMDVWRSFAPHVADLLVTGTRELAAAA